MTVGQRSNSLSEPGKMVVDLMFCCVLFIIAPSMSFAAYRPERLRIMEMEFQKYREVFDSEESLAANSRE